MHGERWLPIGMASMVALGALALGLGESAAAMPVIAPTLGIVAAASSVWLTDVRGWVRLSTAQSNVAGILALCLCGWELRFVAPEGRVLALANLLVYLQCVLLFRKKDARTLSLLALLSLLQVAVAAALSDDMLFGLLLVAYFFVALLTLALCFLRQESQPTTTGQPPAAPAARWWQRSGPRRWRQSDGTERQALDPQPVFSCRHDPLPPLDTFLAPLARRLSVIGLGAIGMTMVLFVVVPRMARTSWDQPLDVRQHAVGFSERVSLGDLGETIEDPQEVMQVRFVDAATKQEKVLAEPPLLRGALLTDYVGDAWRTDEQDVGTMVTLGDRPPQSAALVEQHITIEPLDTDTLFAVFPVFHSRAGQDVLFDETRERLSRRTRRNRPTYVLLTTALAGERQAEIVPALFNQDRRLARLTTKQQTTLPGLVQIATTVVAGIPPEDHYARAKALERHLRNSGDFGYAMTLPPRDPADQDMDPIEHFMTRSRVGHCEYFSSALVLMLRSQGIPARMAVGFRGGEYNPLGSFYQVRQLHAHSWVEAYLDRDQVSADVPLPRRAPGGWLTLDPTPASDEAAVVSQVGRRWPTLSEVAGYSKFLWSTYVVGMNADRQREKIYGPLFERVREALQALTDKETWRALWQDVNAILSGRGGLDPKRWFWWRAGLAASVGTLFLFVAVRMALRLVPRRWRRRPGRAIHRGRSRTVVEVAFYRRLETLLARHQLLRPPQQTQREFAHAAGGQLFEMAATQAAASVPRRIVEAFYRVRFGRQTLDSAESQAVEQALEALAQALDRE